MDAPLAVEAQGAGDHAAPAQPLLVAVVGDGAVEDAHSRGAGRHDDALHGVVEAVARIHIVPLVHYTYTRLGHAHAGSEISRAEVEASRRLVALAMESTLVSPSALSIWASSFILPFSSSSWERSMETAWRSSGRFTLGTMMASKESPASSTTSIRSL